jgi:hypothetical protein
LGLCSWARVQNQFSNLSLSTTRTTPHCQMLVIYPSFNLIFDILPRDPKGQLRFYELLNRTVPCKYVGDFISSYPGMFKDLIQPHSVPARDIQRLLALSYRWRRSGSLKCFQICQAIRANTNILLWPILSCSFLNTG